MHQHFDGRWSCDTLNSTMQHTTLPHRVVRSAKDLASATLSGAAFELNDPRQSKYAGTSSRASTSFEHLSSGSAQTGSRINARGSSFRDETDGVHRWEEEQDFERFQQLDDFQSEFTACLASLKETIALQENSCRPQSDLIMESEPGINETAGFSMIDLDNSASRHQLASESILEMSLDSTRTAAVRRLNQIGAHLQRNLAMQTLQQQEVYLQSHALTNATRSLVLDQFTRQADNDTQTTTHTTEAVSSSHAVQKSVSSQHEDQTAHVNNPAIPPSEKEEDDDGSQRQFHCPYYACHRNLQLHSTRSSSSSKRPCVHVGCDLTIENFTSWAEHIHMPHHDLLGSL